MRAARRTEDADALERLQRIVKLDPPADGVAREKRNVYARRDRRPHVLKHLDRPILVVSDTEKAVRPAQSVGIAMRVEIRDVGHVVAGDSIQYASGNSQSSHSPEPKDNGASRIWQYFP